VLPAAEDPVYGPIAEENLAGVEAQVGEVERAIGRIERLLVTPYGAYPVTQALLRLDPIWDPLRQNPRFKALVEGPELKTIYQ
jgi:serine/threonine-protein kinase